MRKTKKESGKNHFVREEGEPINRWYVFYVGVTVVGILWALLK